MRKNYIILALVAWAGVVFAQSMPSQQAIDAGKGKIKQSISAAQKSALLSNGVSANRASTEDFWIDYTQAEAIYSNSNGYDFYYTSWKLNKNLPNDSVGTFRWFAQVYDQIYNATDTTTCPLDLHTMRIDSIQIPYNHSKTSGLANNKAYVTIYDRSTITITGSGPTANLTGTILFSDTLTLTTSGTVSLDIADLAVWTVHPGVSLAAGETFVVRVDFEGSATQDVFQVYSFFRDECANACAAEPSIVDETSGSLTPNSLYYVNVKIDATTNLSGVNPVYFDCDASGGSTPGACEEYYPQNHWILPYIHADVELGAYADVQPASGCPGDVVHAEIHVCGANGPYTVSWSPTTGVASPTSESTDIVLGATDVTYTVTITDATPATVNVPVLINSNGISVNAGTDQNISCGASANLVATASGELSGITYLWNDGTTTFANSNVTAGSYSVTVTNAAGCSSEDVVNINYTGISANNVDFAPASLPLCAAPPCETFTNNTARKTGWSWNWTNLINSDVSLSENPCFSLTAGTLQLELVADSASCEYSKVKTFTVLSNSDPACTIGFEDIEFGNSIELYPNPTNGSFVLNVPAVSKGIEVTIYTLEGATIMTENNSNSGVFTKTYDLSSMSAGIYFVKVQTGDKVAIKKLILDK